VRYSYRLDVHRWSVPTRLPSSASGAAAAARLGDTSRVDAPTGVISALFTGLVIGGLGRLVVPGRQSVGCLLTILVGLLGAGGGLAIARAIDAAWLLTLLLQIAVSAVLVLIISSVTGRNVPR
jgi:uncharacterized membrane protein YeaQ/YmgE (transglycosylase-associated protein family)